jgi:small subunit ribosomal protein S2
MKKTPDVIFVVDGIFEGQATKEAKSLGLPCFAIANTNGNPFDVTDAIHANTNSVKSLDYLAAALAEAIKKAPVVKTAAPKKAIEKKPAAKKAPAAAAPKKTEEK